MSHLLRSFGPIVVKTSPQEAIRAGVGALVGLCLTGLLVLLPDVDRALGFYLIAPFGATSVLLFAVPNSPLAQPWAAVVGNTVAAVVAMCVCLVVSDPVLRVGLAVGLAIAATMLCRALHPPAGAVAMTVAMNPDAVAKLGFKFAVTPVAAGTMALVLIAIAYAKLTGRRYPFRQFDEPNQHGTVDPEPMERLGLSEAELADILARYRQSFNLGTEDLARLLGAAELKAAAHVTGPLVASDLMSRDLMTVRPDKALSEIARLFETHRFSSLPVVTPEGQFLGVIFQMHLLPFAHENAALRDAGFARAAKRLFGHKPKAGVLAKDIMETSGPRATADTSIDVLLSLMSDGLVDAVPVLEQDRLVGIVTQTDLIAALARRH